MTGDGNNFYLKGTYGKDIPIMNNLGGNLSYFMIYRIDRKLIYPSEGT
jgi:hypothetical protein